MFKKKDKQSKSNIKHKRKKKSIFDNILKKEDPNVRKTIPRRKAVKRRRKKRKKVWKNIRFRGMINWSRVKSFFVWMFKIAIVCLFAFVFVFYFGQRVSTVGDSMNPLLSNGDVVFVNRFIYNVSSPKRGDIVVFKPKGNENSHYYIKRVIALPGETVEFIEGSIYIDGEKFEEKYESTEVNDVGIVTEKMTLGGDEYFVLGDQRFKSEDSRMADVGNVKRGYIYGKTWVVVSPMSHFGFL